MNIFLAIHITLPLYLDPYTNVCIALLYMYVLEMACTSNPLFNMYTLQNRNRK